MTTRTRTGTREFIPALGAVLVLVLLLAPAVGWAQGSDEALRNAKTFFFDREYDKARHAWQAVHDAGEGRESKSALYWIARCSEKLGENERALDEYGAYLDSRPSDRTLREEARTSRVALAAKLYKSGKTRHLDVLFQVGSAGFDLCLKWSGVAGYSASYSIGAPYREGFGTSLLHIGQVDTSEHLPGLAYKIGTLFVFYPTSSEPIL